MAERDFQMTERNATNNGWNELFPVTKAKNVKVAPITGLTGVDVQTALQNLFTFANDGKTAVANAVTAKGVSASPSDTFGTLAGKIGQISTGKKSASGSVTSNSMGIANFSGLNFAPSTVILINSAENIMVVYSKHHNSTSVFISQNASYYLFKRPVSEPVSGVFSLDCFWSNTSFNWIAYE